MKKTVLTVEKTAESILLTLNSQIPDKVKNPFQVFIKPFEAPQRSVKIKI